MSKRETLAQQFARNLNGDTTGSYYAERYGLEYVVAFAETCLYAVAASKYGIADQGEIAPVIDDTVPGYRAACEIRAMLEALVEVGALKMERTVGARQFTIA